MKFKNIFFFLGGGRGRVGGSGWGVRVDVNEKLKLNLPVLYIFYIFEKKKTH